MEQLRINDIFYYDSDEEESHFIDAVFWNNIVDINFKMERITRRKQIDLGENKVFNIRTDNSFDDKIHVTIDNFYFTMSESDSIKVIKYYEDYNKIIAEELVIKENEVDKVYNAIVEETQDMCINFLSMLPDAIFFNEDIHIFFNKVYSFEKISIEYGDTNLCEYKEVIDYINNQLTQLALVLQKDYDIDSEYVLPVTWKLLKNTIKIYYGVKWSNEYEPLLEKSINDCESVEEYIDTYCRSHDIEPLIIQNLALLTYYLMNYQSFDNNDFFPLCFRTLAEIVSNKMKNIKFANFENSIKGNNVKSNTEVSYTINDIDLMDGNEFEHFVCTLFTKMNYRAEVTKKTGDQGLDVIAEKNGKKIGVQAKCYSNAVGNSAIQEAVAGKNYYNCDKIIVVTNNLFTNSAIELAKVNNVVLWDRNILKEKISEIFN